MSLSANSPKSYFAVNNKIDTGHYLNLNSHFYHLSVEKLAFDSFENENHVDWVYSWFDYHYDDSEIYHGHDLEILNLLWIEKTDTLPLMLHNSYDTLA